jgi:hypothetical protein
VVVRVPQQMLLVATAGLAAVDRTIPVQAIPVLEALVLLDKAILVVLVTTILMQPVVVAVLDLGAITVTLVAKAAMVWRLQSQELAFITQAAVAGVTTIL